MNVSVNYIFFFFQAEDGIRDLVRSRGLEMCIRDRTKRVQSCHLTLMAIIFLGLTTANPPRIQLVIFCCCLLYTSDAADERSSVDLGGRRIIKKKN